jgi:hypothetical protein
MLLNAAMDKEQTQGQLLSVYDHWKSNFDSIGLVAEDFSPPLLLNVTNDYCAASTKIMVYGQETYGWIWDDKLTADYPHYPHNWTFSNQHSLKDFLESDDSVESLCWGYAAFSCAQYQPRNKNSPFWRAFREVQNGPDVGVMWSNISRVDYKGGSILSADESARNILESQQATLMLRELSVLKPDACIFFTGPDYDCILKNIFHGMKYVEFGSAPTRELGRVEHAALPRHSFRTYHPRYLNRSRKWHYLDAISRALANAD